MSEKTADALVSANDGHALCVSPRGLVHRGDCPSQLPHRNPVTLPFPQYAAVAVRSCNLCQPVLPEGMRLRDDPLYPPRSAPSRIAPDHNPALEPADVQVQRQDGPHE